MADKQGVPDQTAGRRVLSGASERLTHHAVQPKCGKAQPSSRSTSWFISGDNVDFQSPAIPLRKKAPLCSVPASRPPVSAAKDVRATQSATTSDASDTLRNRNIFDTTSCGVRRRFSYVTVMKS